MEELWVAWFREHTAVTARGNLKQPTRQDAINWVATAWADIPAGIIQESFVLCGITAAISGADDERMFSHVPRVVVEDLHYADDDDDDDDDDAIEESDDEVDFDAFDE